MDLGVVAAAVVLVVLAYVLTTENVSINLLQIHLDCIRDPILGVVVQSHGRVGAAMRRALAAALLALLVAAPAVAQEDMWPTPAELRQDLADDGWEWAASSSFWEGGRGGPVVFLAIAPPLFVSVRDLTLWGYGLTWEEQTAMGWTAFMEVAERLPIDGATLAAVSPLLGQPGCRDFPLHGGTLTIEGSADHESQITIAEGWGPRCGAEVASPEPPATDESPAA